MREVGAFEAKNKLGQLLDLVEQGERGDNSPAMARRSRAWCRFGPPKAASKPTPRCGESASVPSNVSSAASTGPNGSLTGSNAAHASPAHMPRSALCCVLPLAHGTPGQALPPDQDGIVVSFVDSCGRSRPWLRAVRLQELSTTLLSDIVQRPGQALVATAVGPRALPLPALVVARLLFVAPFGADVRPPLPCAGAPRVVAAPARAVFRLAARSRSRLWSKVSDAPAKLPARTPTPLRLQSTKQNEWWCPSQTGSMHRSRLRRGER